MYTIAGGAKENGYNTSQSKPDNEKTILSTPSILSYESVQVKPTFKGGTITKFAQWVEDMMEGSNVVKADVADQYQTAESLSELAFAVEAGSAGEAAVKELGIEPTAVQSQSSALMEVEAGTADACVIDLLMAGAMIGEGTSYPDLTYTVQLTSEEYGVGFRTGSDLAAKLNEFFASAYADGSLMEIAKTYGVQESIIAK